MALITFDDNNYTTEVPVHVLPAVGVCVWGWCVFARVCVCVCVSVCVCVRVLTHGGGY